MVCHVRGNGNAKKKAVWEMKCSAGPAQRPQEGLGPTYQQCIAILHMATQRHLEAIPTPDQVPSALRCSSIAMVPAFGLGCWQACQVSKALLASTYLG